MMRSRVTWLIMTDVLLAVVCAVAIAGEVLIFRKLQTIERRIETLDPPSDAVASEIEDLRARLATLEKKARATKSKAKSITP